MSSRRSESPNSSSQPISRSAAHPYAPSQPSNLRESHTVPSSPEARRTIDISELDREDSGSLEGVLESFATQPNTEDDDDKARGLATSGSRTASETTSLLGSACPHPGPCNHGTFSPHLRESRASSIRSGFAGSGPIDAIVDEQGGLFGSITGFFGSSSGKKRSTTHYLAEQAGITNTRTMYLAYYIPSLTWVRQYRWSYLRGDFVSALTMASFYIPMALSFASNLGHIPPINGLYSFIFHPLIYAFLGSCPQMVVGPEAASSLLVGSVVRSSVDSGGQRDFDDELNARVAGVVTGMAGAIILIAGLCRLGFVDNVLSRPFIRGFISAVGFVIVVDQLIPELGLAALAETTGASHGSSVEKLGFLIKNVNKSHKLTAIVSGVSFVVIVVLRQLKHFLQPRFPSAAYIPDRLFVVVLATIIIGQYGWDKQGVEVLGEIKSPSGDPFPFHWPFQTMHMKHVREAMGTSFVIALLGFFESSIAAKGLAGVESKSGDGIQGMSLSPNRELVALGMSNFVGGCFCALPAFGGYARSKVNASTGGKTPMSSVFLSLLTILCVFYLLPYFYFLPKAVLCMMITVIAWSLIEEAPADIYFFFKIGGWTELGLMLIIFAVTIFYSLTLGIATGVGLSLLSVIKHSTRPRIQILGRIPGTNRFENAEDNPESLEFIEGCLIVKIPEPLTFANTGDLKSRLRRLELYGTTAAHPALPRVRPPEHNKNIIFDIHGVTGLDGSGTQVLEEIVRGYRDRGVRVFFSRGPVEGSPIYELFVRSGILEAIGGKSHYVSDVHDALRLSEMDSDSYDGRY
ncbi:sulfate transporter family-domain-containing protein [Xylogone sp. PMI_703]|nr:sulfate transporter family-domain-containing protein [Xylogone sp. PMI_703]